MKLPVFVRWGHIAGSLEAHAFLSTEGAASGYGLCHRYAFVKMSDVVPSALDVARCAHCESHATRIAIALPHADRLASRAVAKARAFLKDAALRLAGRLL